MKTTLRIVLSLGLLAMFSACSSDGVVGDDDGVDAGLAPDADLLAPDADPFAPDADPLAPDAHQTPPDAAVMPPDATVGPADAGFAPWASWDGIYSMAWVLTDNTCVLPGMGYWSGWNYVRLVNTATPGGIGYYEQLYDAPDYEIPAHIVAPGAMTIDGFGVPMSTFSPCAALQTSATTFQCALTRHVLNDPGGPCDVTWQVSSTFITL